MRKLVAIFLICLFALFLIAARPRPCRTRGECFFRIIATVTVTERQSSEVTHQPDNKSSVISFPETPVPYITYPLQALTSTLCVPMWADGYGVFHCGNPPDPWPTVVPFPISYPPPATPPPAGYP